VGKQYRLLGGVPLIRHTLTRLAGGGRIGSIALALPPPAEAPPGLLDGLKVPVRVVEGGRTRQESVARGLAALPAGVEWVVVHDGARPLLPPELVEACLAGAQESGASIAALPVSDTVKRAREEGFAAETLSREGLWLAQTPQVARRDLLERAFEDASARGREGTDEAALLESIGVRVRLVPGAASNLKITTPEDLALAEAYLAHSAEEGERSPRGGSALIRVGMGFDVHRFEAGRRLVLGGVEVPFEKGLAGHSDADVLTHAICDALLGAAALGDIGLHFPDTDARYRGADSMELLRRVVALAAARGLRPHNVDAVVVAERPRLAPHVGEMRRRLAGALGLPEGAVSVKATTSERLGFTGRGEGIAAHAVCALREGPS